MDLCTSRDFNLLRYFLPRLLSNDQITELIEIFEKTGTEKRTILFGIIIYNKLNTVCHLESQTLAKNSCKNTYIVDRDFFSPKVSVYDKICHTKWFPHPLHLYNLYKSFFLCKSEVDNHNKKKCCRVFLEFDKEKSCSDKYLLTRVSSIIKRTVMTTKPNDYSISDKTDLGKQVLISDCVCIKEILLAIKPSFSNASESYVYRDKAQVKKLRIVVQNDIDYSKKHDAQQNGLKLTTLEKTSYLRNQLLEMQQQVLDYILASVIIAAKILLDVPVSNYSWSVYSNKNLKILNEIEAKILAKLNFAIDYTKGIDKKIRKQVTRYRRVQCRKNGKTNLEDAIQIIKGPKAESRANNAI